MGSACGSWANDCPPAPAQCCLPLLGNTLEPELPWGWRGSMERRLFILATEILPLADGSLAVVVSDEKMSKGASFTFNPQLCIRFCLTGACGWG